MSSATNSDDLAAEGLQARAEQHTASKSVVSWMRRSTRVHQLLHACCCTALCCCGSYAAAAFHRQAVKLKARTGATARTAQHTMVWQHRPEVSQNARSLSSCLWPFAASEMLPCARAALLTRGAADHGADEASALSDASGGAESVHHRGERGRGGSARGERTMHSRGEFLRPIESGKR